MIIDLNWKYVGSHEKLWQGRGIGLWSTVVFTISFEDKTTDMYLITTNIKQIQKATCIGLESAKQKSQALLISYALSQSIL